MSSLGESKAVLEELAAALPSRFDMSLNLNARYEEAERFWLSAYSDRMLELWHDEEQANKPGIEGTLDRCAVCAAYANEACRNRVNYLRVRAMLAAAPETTPEDIAQLEKAGREVYSDESDTL